MYTAIRKIHLLIGLMLLVFSVMYFVTGYVIIHQPWFKGEGPTKTVQEYVLTYEGDNAAMQKYLQQEYDLRGRRGNIREFKDGRVAFQYVRPGYRYQALVSADRQRVKITEDKMDAAGVMVVMHRIHGYGGGWFYTLWAVMIDVVSVAMIVFSLTGIYLWYKLTKKRAAGYVILGSTYGLTVAVIIYLLYR